MSEQRVLIVRRACAQIDQVARSNRARVTINLSALRRLATGTVAGLALTTDQ